MKSIEEIRKETPLSVTTTDNPIFTVTEDLERTVFDSLSLPDGKYTIETDRVARLNKGDRLRVLQCFDDSRPNWYRWGDKNEKILIEDKYTRLVFGDMAPTEV